jgi:hypothetical protein
MAPKSTSGLKITWGGVTLECGSRTQPVPALSSAEAEIIASNDAGKEAVYLKHLLDQIEEKPVEIDVKCDASAAVAFSDRMGLGRARHLKLRQQEQVQAKVIKVTKVWSEDNEADVFTKGFAQQAFELQRWRLGLRDEEEQAAAAGKGRDPQPRVVATGDGNCDYVAMVGPSSSAAAGPAEGAPWLEPRCRQCGRRLCARHASSQRQHRAEAEHSSEQLQRGAKPREAMLAKSSMSHHTQPEAATRRSTWSSTQDLATEQQPAKG